MQHTWAGGFLASLRATAFVEQGTCWCKQVSDNLLGLCSVLLLIRVQHVPYLDGGDLPGYMLQLQFIKGGCHRQVV